MTKKLLLAWVIAMNLISIPVAWAADAAPAVGSGLQDEFFMFDLRSITHEDVKEEKWVRGGLNYIFERVVTIMAATISTAAVLMIMVGGFMMLASGGSHKMLDTGKAIVFKSLLGLGAVLGAYIFVQTVQILIKSIYG